MPSRQRKKRAPKRITKSLKKTIAKEISASIETKCHFFNYDEQAVAQNSHTTLLTPTFVALGTAGNQRIGQKIKPTYLELNLYFRPRSLVNTGLHTGDPAAQFTSAFYSRIIIFRQKRGVSFVAHTPAPVTTGNNDLWLGTGGRGEAMQDNFKDLFAKLNPRLGTVLYDKKFFIPMQYKMNNTREIRFKYAYPKTFYQTYNDDSGYSDTPVVIMIINRYADDDTHASHKSIEYTGNSKFYYKDA